MPLFKATFLLRYKQAGASISLYKNGASYQDTMDDALNLFKLGMGPLFGEGVELGAVRVSDDAVPKDSLVEEVGIEVTERKLIGLGKAKQVKPAEPAQPNDNNSCLLLTLFSSPVRKGKIYLRFYPDTVALGSRFVGAGPYNIAITDFTNELKRSGWGFKGVNNGNGVPIKAIATNGGAPNIVVITAPGHGCVADGQCRITRVKGNNNAINNVWKVFSINGNDVTLASSNALAGFVWQGDGFIKPMTRTLATVNSVQVANRISERKSGRPFGAPVGRRRARRK